jgi:hypothetical protein
VFDRLLNNGTRSNDQQAPQRSLAHFRCRAELLLAPLECCDGVSPTQAAKSRPLLKASAGGAAPWKIGARASYGQATPVYVEVEAQMQIHRFQHEGMAFTALSSGAVIFTLRREEGPFGVELTVEDAKRLLADLPEQIRIASGKNA